MDTTLSELLRVIDQGLARHPDTKDLPSDNFVDVPPGLVAVRELRLKNDAGRFVIRRSTEDVSEGFEWLAEITLDPKPGEYKHFLLRRDGSLVEAYGKNLFEADLDTAASLIKELQVLLA